MTTEHNMFRCACASDPQDTFDFYLLDKKRLVIRARCAEKGQISIHITNPDHLEQMAKILLAAMETIDGKTRS